MQRIIVVSGGGTGIGRAIARAQAQAGDRVLIAGRRAEVLEKTAAEINAECGAERVVWHAADLTDLDSLVALADHVRATFGTVYAVVNNAGGAAPIGSTLGELREAWRKTYDLNVVSAVLLTKALEPIMEASGGRVVAIGSMSSKSGGGGAHYAASKAALSGWILSLAGELGPRGVTVNAVLPGYTPDTELFGPGLPPNVHERLVAPIALGRAGTSDDVAGAVRYLLSTEAAFVTGQFLEVAGGSLPLKIDS